MDFREFVAENKELLIAVGSVLAALLGVVSAIIRRRSRIEHVILQERTTSSGVQGAGEATKQRNGSASMSPESDADLEPTTEPNSQRQANGDATPHAELDRKIQAVRRIETDLNRISAEAIKSQPPLSLVVHNRIKREMSRNPDCDLTLFCGLAKELPVSTTLLYLKRLADVERTWRALSEAREFLARHLDSTPAPSSSASEARRSNSLAPESELAEMIVQPFLEKMVSAKIGGIKGAESAD